MLTYRAQNKEVGEIYALFALSLNLLIGYAGNVSFGHAAYFAIGGYTCAILLTSCDWPLWISFPAAIALSGCAALFIGFFCVRLNDIYFAMLTLAFAMLVWAVACYRWPEVSGFLLGLATSVVYPLFLDRLQLLYPLPQPRFCHFDPRFAHEEH